MPQTNFSALKALHTAGRDDDSKMAHVKSSNKWMQRTPAFLPLGMPGSGEEIDGAMQQAPQLALHSMRGCLIQSNKKRADQNKFYSESYCYV